MEDLIKELKNQGVLKSPLVEAAFRFINRKGFVLPEQIGEAYANHPLPIGEGQTISQPYTVAFMLDLLEPEPGEKILDVGAGSGWQTAVLAYIASQGNGKVIALERIPELCKFAQKNVDKYGFIKRGAAEVICRDATNGLAEEAPFDKIIAAAAAKGEIPQAWRDQLKVGGRIVAPVDDFIKLYVKKSESEWEEKEFLGFAFVPLVSNKGVKQAGEPPETKTKTKKRWGRILFAIYLAFALFFLGGTYATFMPLDIPEPVEVEIPQGAGSRVIGGLLKTKGIVRFKWAFVTYATIGGTASKLKPGLYEFSGRITIAEVARNLVKGERYPNERIITIPEGWNSRDIGENFEKAGMFPAEDWWKVAGLPAVDYKTRKNLTLPKNFSDKFAFLKDKPSNIGLEGFLFPDTYRFFRDASPEDIALKMLENFDRKVTADIRSEAARQKKSIFEIITMASLLEKEIPDKEERKIAAGVLWKRLEIGMPLQVDATLNYITGKSGQPSAADLAISSPYNTYRQRGLPLGPIANPGLDAITAALYPKTSPYLYYLSDRSGKTIFSRTLEEHNIAKLKYLR